MTRDDFICNAILEQLRDETLRVLNGGEQVKCIEALIDVSALIADRLEERGIAWDDPETPIPVQLIKDEEPDEEDSEY